MRRGNFNPLVKWAKIVASIGMPNLKFHDLRHTGNTLAAPGASLRDLMTRMGHDSPRAAMIYQHATTVEDKAIADRLSNLVDAHRAESEQADDEDDGGPACALAQWVSGTWVAREPSKLSMTKE
jgi:hypothetical protein